MVFIRNAFKNTFLFFFTLLISCGSGTKTSSQTTSDEEKLEINKKSVISENQQQDSLNVLEPVIVGANQTELYLPLLQNKKIAIVGNQTSVIFKFPNISPLLQTEKVATNTLDQYTHLVDSLLSKNIDIKKVFAPEHGFRGKADAGELVADEKDIKTGLPIVSLHGKSKKPSAASLSDIDLVVFDIQDVGARFYTYISTLHYVMQACAENNIPLLILDRPNPNGHYIDGPTLEIEHSSFVGVHPIPLVHGMTIGEYAKMVNGEGWLGNDLKCEIQIIPVKNYTHQTYYSLAIRPSPNLPNDRSINLYPSLGFFEGTTINAGRGTEMQFQIFGSPDFPIDQYDFAYTPQPNFGAKYPKHKGEVCYGKDLRQIKRLSTINIQWLLDAYNNSKNKEGFFNNKSFTIHAGTKNLQQQIEQGYTAREIKKTWIRDLEKFKKIRAQYLLYK
ncbi:exo-beta-N-acetylmuramidase NamZ domain-containing protein [Aquimarina sp. LLG6339-5]|uniref:exo-beta-N-acetylmuramidase NamZ family protein n=1 Tax=Aquimarina sp. LLG6339-5 TaxID=3160830 RepID=UPI00386BB47B